MRSDGSLKRECPWVGCRYHLGLDVDSEGFLAFPRGNPWEVDPCCALDVAENRDMYLRQGDYHISLADVGEIIGCTKEWVRQIQDKALRKLSRRLPRKDVLDALEELADTRASKTVMEDAAPGEYDAIHIRDKLRGYLQEQEGSLQWGAGRTEKC